MRRELALASVCLGAVLAAGCEPPRGSGLGDDAWVRTAPTNTRRSGGLADPALVESSGAAVSRAHRGVFWTHNDTGSGPILFATDTLGTALGRWMVTGARSVDWEDIALGPCPAGDCLTIGDVGDNAEARPSVMLYRIPEPNPAAGAAATVRAETLSVRYPDRPRDVEALFVDRDGGTWLITKGRSTGILLYHIPGSAWSAGAVVATLVDTLPIQHHLPTRRAVTGAALAPDGRRVVVRTYRDLFLLVLEGGRLLPAPAPNRCEILGLEVQGEAVDWWDDQTLLLTSEGRPGAVHLLGCGGGG